MNLKQRTHYAGSLRASEIGKEVVINGWVAVNRDLGGVLFFDVRDRSGIVQCVVRPEQAGEQSGALYEEAKKLRSEFVVSVSGIVKQRESVNSKIPSGEVEIIVSSFDILNDSDVPPFEIKEEVTANEDLRLKYRYLDLRRPQLQQNLRVRHKITHAIRDYFTKRDFIEIETPILMKATPEGARDFLVPSRLHKGKFYALPQSPQIYKQLCMVAGLDKYFQIAKCFRDEDLRADRQPEFTQLDVETSFPDEQIVYELMENCLHWVWDQLGLNLPRFRRVSYTEAIEKYGSDKPDLRYALEIVTLSNQLRGRTEFKPFNDALASEHGVIGAVVAPGCAEWSRKQLDTLTDHAKLFGASGLIWAKVTSDSIESSAKKFLSEEVTTLIGRTCNAKVGDIILIVAHPIWDRAYTILGAVRSEVAKRLELTKGRAFEFAPLWVTEMPMFEWNEELKEYTSMHHPFTSPDLTSWNNRHEGMAFVKARAYDIVINGYELGSGSIRIHDRRLQEEVFDMLKISKEEQQKKFGFLLDAFRFGAPPHGGMALGIDRIAMLCCGTENIRDVIAFPKTTTMQSLMDDAPSEVEERQLRELRISIKE